MTTTRVLTHDTKIDRGEIVSIASVLADLYMKDRLGHAPATERSAPFFAPKFLRIANELERRHVLQYNDICGSLVINGRTVYGVFLRTADGLFQDGINWGRIVGLYVFAASLSQACISRGMQATVEEVKKWLIAYIRSNLVNWMMDHGGWDGFNAHFKDPGAAYPARLMTLGLAMVSALALYTVVKS
jgi:hypothetical protein